METWLAVLTIAVGVIGAGVAWRQSFLSRQHADRADASAQAANRIQAEMAERDRLRFAREESEQGQDPVALLVKDGRLVLSNGERFDLSKVIVYADNVWLKVGPNELSDVQSLFPLAPRNSDNYGALRRGAELEVAGTVGRLTRGARALVEDYWSNGFPHQLPAEPVEIRAQVTVEHSLATVVRSGEVVYRIRARVPLQKPDSSAPYDDDTKLASGDLLMRPLVFLSCLRESGSAVEAGLL